MPRFMPIGVTIPLVNITQVLWSFSDLKVALHNNTTEVWLGRVCVCVCACVAFPSSLVRWPPLHSPLATY
jgi:hypothetical protein